MEYSMHIELFWCTISQTVAILVPTVKRRTHLLLTDFRLCIFLSGENCYFRKWFLHFFGPSEIPRTPPSRWFPTVRFCFFTGWECDKTMGLRTMSHVQMSRVARMHESCRTYAWVVSHVCMSRVARMHESSRMYGYVMPNVGMSHVTSMSHVTCVNMSLVWTSHVKFENKSCHMYEWVISHVWMRHMYESVASRVRMRHVTCMNETCHMYG